jgi:hypothetical protein
MEVDHDVSSMDHTDLENKSQIIAPKMPFRDFTNAKNSSARGLATAPSHAGAILIASKTI